MLECFKFSYTNTYVYKVYVYPRGTNWFAKVGLIAVINGETGERNFLLNIVKPNNKSIKISVFCRKLV